jgi:hypothetical protein
LKFTTKLLFVAVSLFFLTDCKKEFTSQKESGFLFFDEPGNFRLNTLMELTDGNILVGGTNSFKRADNLFGTDSATLYLVNPNTLSFKKIPKLFSDLFLYGGVIESENQSLIVWAMERGSNLSILRKYDKSFKIIKQKTIQSNTPFKASYNINILADGSINSIIKLKDGKFLLQGFSGLRSQFIKFDSDLNIIWQRENNNVLRDFVETEDGSILSGGYSDSTHKAVITKFRSDGSMLWEKEMNLPLNASFYNVITKNSEYFGTGYYSWSPNFQGKTEGFIFKFNSNGDSLALKSFISSLDDEGHKLLATADGGFIICMHIEFQASRKSKLVKLDANLNTVWEKSIGKNGAFVSLVSAITLKNGNIVIGGFGDHIVNDINGKDGFILFLDKNGNPI